MDRCKQTSMFQFRPEEEQLRSCSLKGADRVFTAPLCVKGVIFDETIMIAGNQLDALDLCQ